MKHEDKFRNESQDARRRDQHDLVHPEDKNAKKQVAGKQMDKKRK